MATKKHDRSVGNARLEAPAALRLGLRSLQAVSPRWAAAAMHRLWFTPPSPRPWPSSRRLFTRAAALRLAVKGRRVAAWRFGVGPPVALLHGWGGHAGHLAAFVQPLLEAGFQVVALDAPGHGESEGSAMGFRQSSFFDFADALEAAVGEVGPLAGVVAHSGAAGAVGLALRRGLALPRVVLVAPLVHPWRYAAPFAEALGLEGQVLELFREGVERRLGVRWEELELTAPALRALAPPTLVVHDRDDREVPHAEGAALAAAWPAELRTTTGLGHLRVLGDAGVITAAVGFLRQGSPRS